MKKIKLDENFPPSCLSLFIEGNIDASSVYSQKISGVDDDNLYKICIGEERTIVSFDLDFANIIRYPSEATKGIIICRTGKRINLESIKLMCLTIIGVIKNNDLDGNLFIVEDSKVRVRKPDID